MEDQKVRHEKLRARLREIDTNATRVYQKRLPTSLCPRCAKDVSVSALGLYTCECGAEWSRYFHVYLPKPSALLRRTVSNPEFKKNMLRDLPVVAARFAALAQDARTIGVQETLKRAKTGYYKTLIPQRQEGENDGSGSQPGTGHTEEGSSAARVQ